MQGSLYPDGVTVDRVALSRTELTKAAEILRNRKNWTSRGVLSGGTVTVNGAPTLEPWKTVSIDPFSGFTPSGEYIECSVPYGNVAMSDSELNTVNYVGAVYTEISTHSQPHESNQQTYPVFSEMAWRIRVYTEAAYNALPTSDANLANDSRDRFLILAKVTAQGEESLTSANIELPPTFDNILFSNPIDLSTITGIRIKGVSQNMAIGDGEFAYTYSDIGVTPTYTFTWKAAGDTGPGAEVPVTEDDTFEIPDESGNNYLTVEMSSALLPLVDVTETVTILNLYHQSVSRLTGEDALHRNMQGTGIPTPGNPHGMTVDDLSGQDLSVLNEHQNVMHANGINRISKATCLATEVEIKTSGDLLEVTPPSGSDLYYVNGKKLSEIIPETGVVQFDTPADEAAYYYEIFVSDSGSIEYSGSLDGIPGKAAYPDDDRQCSGTQIVGMSDNYPAGSYLLQILTSGSSGAYTWDISWGGDDQPSGVPQGDSIRLVSVDNDQVIRLYDSSGVLWIDLWFRTDGSSNDDSHAPLAASNKDMINVRPSLTEGDDSYMKIAGTCYWWDTSSGGKWVMGFDPVNSGRGTNDMRTWGNTGIEHLTTEMLETMFHEPLNTQGRSGCLMRRTSDFTPFEVTAVGDGHVQVGGGIYYTRGIRVVRSQYKDLGLSPNTEYLIWGDETGEYYLEEVNGGDIVGAMQYILGDPYDRENVSNEFHSTHSNYAPERGVIFARLTTDGSSVPEWILDYTQNINQVDNRWSVGSRSSVPYVDAHQSQCAYDNLHSACAYAEWSMQSESFRGSRVITVEGYAQLASTPILYQPVGVTVQGTGAQAIDETGRRPGMVRILSTSENGTWKLQGGCKLLNLHVMSDHQITASSIHMSSNSEVSGCTFTSPKVGGEGNPHLSHVNGCVQAKVINNTFDGAMFIRQDTDSCEGFVISNNYVQYSNPAPTFDDRSSGIYLRNVVNSTITGNTIRVLDNWNNDSAAIEINNGSRMTITGNNLALNDTHQGTRSLRGIWIYDSNDIVVTGNCIGYDDDVNFKNGIGVHVEDSSVIQVSTNDISHMGIAIRSDGAIRNAKFCGNIINRISCEPIRVQMGEGATYSYGVSIDDNMITNSGLGSTGSSLVPTEPSAMILVSGNPHSNNKDVKSLSICRNTIENSASAGSLRVIYVNLNGGGDGRTYGVKICDNQIRDFIGGGTYLRGIDVAGQVVDGSHYMRGLDINGNYIYMNATAQAAGSTATNVGIRIQGYAVDINVCNNNIRVYDSAAVRDMSGVGMYIGSRSEGTECGQVNIRGNKIEALGMGIYLSSPSGTLTDNYIYVHGGDGIHIWEGTNYHVITGNVIHNKCRFNTKYTGNDSGGSHCISIPQNGGATGCHIKNNRLFMDAYDAGSDNVVGQQSAAIRVRELHWVTICENYIHMQVRQISGTPTDPDDMVWAVYVKVLQGGGQENWITIDNNQFTDDDWSNNQSVVGGLGIECVEGSWNPSTDYLYGSVKGNTWNTALTIYGGADTNFSNKEQYGNYGTIGDRLAPTQFPYTIYVSPYFTMSESDPTGSGWVRNFNPRAQIHFASNTIRPNYKVAPPTGGNPYDKPPADNPPGFVPGSEVLCKVYLPTSAKGVALSPGYGRWVYGEGFGGVCSYDTEALSNSGPWKGNNDFDEWTNDDYKWII